MQVLLKQEIEEREVSMCEETIFTEPALVTCSSLGASIGLFLYDTLNQIGGVAYITLPEYQHDGMQDSDLDYAIGASFKLLTRMIEKGSKTSYVVAKLVGGANVSHRVKWDVGEKHSLAIMKKMVNCGVYIGGVDLGGYDTKTAKFNTTNGTVQVFLESGKAYTI